jgi:AcrR family transcriptional regulator
MSDADRPLRADAERNRRRLLDAAAEVFYESGLDVGVAEIAQRAGVGRGTLFRNFPTKQALIAAIVVDRMHYASSRGRELLDSPDPGEALFELLDEMFGRQQVERTLFEAVQDTFLADPEIRAAHADFVEVLGELLSRAQEAGTIRSDVGPLDVLLLFKGVCETASAFRQLDPGLSERHLDLVRAALSPPSGAQALRGRSPTLEDLEHALEPADRPLYGTSSR